MTEQIAVIGAGAWGTTLAIRLAEAGRAVVLWAHTPGAAAELASDRQNRRYLPDAAFPAVPGRQCSWCDFRASCPAGQAAAPPRETWSFLPEQQP